jgi:hypothetical protein
MDANEKDEIPRRRNQFKRWLLKVWEWADEERPAVAHDVAELVSHADEEDYPLWRGAASLGRLDDGELAKTLRQRFGVPVSGPVATSWEKQINYAPVIYLDEAVWRHIHGELGWVNRDHDLETNTHCFWLWSNAANQVRFVMRPKVVVQEPEDA